MKETFKFAVFMLMAVMSLCLTSCGDDEEDDSSSGATIVGVWTCTSANYGVWEDEENTKVGDILTFNADNTYTIRGNNIERGRYSVSGNTLIVTSGGITIEFIINELSSTTLSITQKELGVKLSFKKQNNSSQSTSLLVGTWDVEQTVYYYEDEWTEPTYIDGDGRYWVFTANKVIGYDAGDALLGVYDYSYSGNEIILDGVYDDRDMELLDLTSNRFVYTVIELTSSKLVIKSIFYEDRYGHIGIGGDCVITFKKRQ